MRSRHSVAPDPINQRNSASAPGGRLVVVHLGFALSRMDEAEAHTVLDGLQALHDLYAGELPA